MTTEERFERIEHVTAGLAEQAKRDREENRQLWRDTQRQLQELTARTSDLTLKVADLTLKVADTNDTVARVAEEMREGDRRLGERIDNLVSAIGQFISAQTPKQ